MLNEKGKKSKRNLIIIAFMMIGFVIGIILGSELSEDNVNIILIITVVLVSTITFGKCIYTMIDFFRDLYKINKKLEENN